MQRIIYVTTLVVLTECYGAADTNVTENIIDNSTSLAKYTMTKPNSIIENAPEHAIVKSLSNLMSKHVFHSKEQAKPIFRNEYEKNHDININIKVNYENKNTSRSTQQEDVNNIKNRKRGLVFDDSNNDDSESYELLTGDLKEQCDYRNKENCKASNNLAETVFVSRDNILENHSEQDDVESDVGNAETFYYADGKDDSNDNPEIEFLVEYDEALKQKPKKSKTRFNIVNKKRASSNNIYVHMSQQKRYKKPNLLLKNQIKIHNASKENKPNELIEIKRYNKIVREVTRYPHVKNKRFKILSQPKIKVKKVANSANKKLKRTKMFKLIGIKTNNNYGVTSKYKYVASQSYPNKQLKQKYRKWKFNKLYNDRYTTEEETQEWIHDTNKTRVRQKNNYDAFDAAKKHNNLPEDTKTFNIILTPDKEISSISPKDSIKTLNNASDNKILMDTLTKKLSQDVIINNITDYLLTKIVQKIALQNKLARKNVTVDERIMIDLKGELTEVESESAGWSEPSHEVRVLGGAMDKLNLRMRRLQVK